MLKMRIHQLMHKFTLQSKIRHLPMRASGKLLSTVTTPIHPATNIIYSRHEDCQLTNMTVVQHFFQCAALYPKAIALECGITGRNFTYDQLCTLVRRFGSCLLRMGFKRGEVLGLVLPNIPELPVALLGASGVGMPVTTINPIYTPEEIARQIQNSGASVIVTASQLAESIRQVQKLCPLVRRLIVIDGAQDGFASFSEMLQDSGELFQDDIQYDPDDLFILPYSSGTTGLPKGVMLTHSSVGSNLQQLLHPGTFKTQYATETYQEVFLCVLPLFHAYGMVVVMLQGFAYGAKLITLPSFTPASFIKAINDHKPTVLHLVPPLVFFLGKFPELKVENLRRTHTLMCGAAPLGLAVANAFIERLNNPDLLFQEGYGLTEASPVTHTTPLVNGKIGSVGEPISRTQVKIIDSKTGEALGPRKEGEVCIFGPQVMKGYYKNPKATEETIDSSGWLHTGDIGYYDEDNQFFIVDRQKELIKVKAFQVAPSELEDLLRCHPAVMDVAVVGVPDDESGERPRAFIVKKAGSTIEYGHQSNCRLLPSIRRRSCAPIAGKFTASPAYHCHTLSKTGTTSSAE